MRLATLTKTQQSSPSAQAEQKQPGLSQLLVLSTPLLAMTAAYNTSGPGSAAPCVPAPVPADCPRDSRDVSVIKAAAGDSSVGTCLSSYTAIFVFLGVFFLLSVSPRLHPTQPFTTPGQFR